MKNEIFDEWTQQPNDIEHRLWAYIDGLSEEPAAIEKLVRENVEWRDMYNELLQVHQSLGLYDLEEPSLRFTKNIMEEISRLQIPKAARSYINKNVVWGIALFFLVVIAGLLVFGLSQVSWSTGDAGQNPLAIDFSKVDVGSLFNNTLLRFFVMFNIILGLLFFDRYMGLKRKKRVVGNTR